VQIGGDAGPEGGLLLATSFFQRGGFGEYKITGIGGRDAAGNVIPGSDLIKCVSFCRFAQPQEDLQFQRR
jgi:hypothetical protein